MNKYIVSLFLIIIILTTGLSAANIMNSLAINNLQKQVNEHHKVIVVQAEIIKKLVKQVYGDK
jgi:hypothetical protein